MWKNVMFQTLYLRNGFLLWQYTPLRTVYAQQQMMDKMYKMKSQQKDGHARLSDLM